MLIKINFDVQYLHKSAILIKSKTSLNIVKKIKKLLEKYTLIY